MELNTENRKKAVYFTGIEVENTIMKGEKTLFVVGIQDVTEIMNIANREKVQHVYLGTSQCFNPETRENWEEWDHFINGLLMNEFWVTLDFDVSHVPTMTEYGWMESYKFIPMVSVKIPFISQFNYNTTIKLDDRTWGFSNPGVWCHSMHELMTRETFTSWKDYVGDTVVEPK